MKKLFITIVAALIALAAVSGCTVKDDDAAPAEDGLIINQIMGIGDKSNDNQAASHSFVELYNPTEVDVDLSRYSLQCAPNGTTWVKKALVGTIPAKHSFLVVLTKFTNTGDGVYLTLSDYDLEWKDAALSNKGLKVVLLKSNALLTVKNPFDIDGKGTKAAGYADMIGVAGNDEGNTIDGYESAYLSEQSKQKALRRRAFTDTDNNAADLETIDYRSGDEAFIRTYRPRSLASGAWGGRAGLTLSAKGGVYAAPFTLTLTGEKTPGHTVYYTIDGTEPAPGQNRYRTFSTGTSALVAGEFPEKGLTITDRTGYWREAVTASIAADFPNKPQALADILQGTAFKFRVFDGKTPVSDTVTETYFVSPDFESRYNKLPILSITADRDAFFQLYKNSNDDSIRHVFDYEFFFHENGAYRTAFSLPGSTGIGGKGSSGGGQKTLNVNFSKNPLKGSITHPLFPGVDTVKRFRIWNGGNQYLGDICRDAFMQKSAEGLNVTIAESSLCIVFVNGDYWGFSNLRENYSQDYAETHFGTDKNNFAQMTATYYRDPDSTPHFYHEVADGDEAEVLPLYDELISFITNNDLSTNAARKTLFEQYFDEDNFIDYLIVNTYYDNLDWPQNNTRLYRAIQPQGNSIHNDGKWRFMLHDMDLAAYTHEFVSNNKRLDNNHSQFPELFVYSRVHNGAETVPAFSRIYSVFKNPAFKAKFKARALAVIKNEFKAETLTALYNSFHEKMSPLLDELYNRFSPTETRNPVQDLRNYNAIRGYFKDFLAARNGHYTNIINAL